MYGEGKDGNLITVQGKVVDQDSLPLVGVTVIVKGLGTGGTTSMVFSR